MPRRRRLAIIYCSFSSGHFDLCSAATATVRVRVNSKLTQVKDLCILRGLDQFPQRCQAWCQTPSAPHTLEFKEHMWQGQDLDGHFDDSSTWKQKIAIGRKCPKVHCRTNELLQKRSALSNRIIFARLAVLQMSEKGRPSVGKHLVKKWPIGEFPRTLSQSAVKDEEQTQLIKHLVAVFEEQRNQLRGESVPAKATRRLPAVVLGASRKAKHPAEEVDAVNELPKMNETNVETRRTREREVES